MRPTEAHLKTQYSDLSGHVPAVVLNWNGWEDTLDCLRSIKGSEHAGFVPVVVDNGSDAESLECLKEGCKQIFSKTLFLKKGDLEKRKAVLRDEVGNYPGGDLLVFIENGENLGFARGNNVGLRFAELIGAEWVMVLNNDTVVAPEMFRELRAFREAHREFVAITPQIRYYEPNTRIQNCGGDLTYFGSRKYRFAGKDASGLPKLDSLPVTFVTGCALLFKYTVTGALSEDFFFGEEDYEFSLRMKKRGLKMACAYGAVVHHRMGSSAGRHSRPVGSILAHYANRLVNTRAYYSNLRWQVTKLLAYLRLPVLLRQNGVGVGKSIFIVRRTEAYLQAHERVSRADYESLINGDPQTGSQPDGDGENSGETAFLGAKREHGAAD